MGKFFLKGKLSEGKKMKKNLFLTIQKDSQNFQQNNKWIFFFNATSFSRISIKNFLKKMKEKELKKKILGK